MQEFFRPVIQDALRKAEIETGQPVQIEKPASAKFGHFSTNIAFLAAKELGKNPRALAQELIEHLSFPSGSVEKAEVAGPGFINFFLTAPFIMDSLTEVLQRKDDFGRGTSGKGKKAIVEYVSANPTGPLTIGRAVAASLATA